MQHGKGILIFTDGSRYEGEWIEDRISSRGTLSVLDGKSYKGEWKEGKFNIIAGK